MPFTIGAPCIDVTDRLCVGECPVNGTHPGDRELYINSNECIDCGACEPVCPVEAITTVRAAVGDQRTFVAEDARFFIEPLPGRHAPLGNPGGASKIGEVSVDTPFVASWS